ncbi:MAG: prolyl oligopeptidase family serine peptidase [Spirochaetaceae bacterium]|jgi:predicted peptidase|nr:prolyl oligopeptidase family serine peptidase [Spirochaetaceae bacterium]
MKKMVLYAMTIFLMSLVFSCKSGPDSGSGRYTFRLVNQVLGYGQDTTHIIIDLGKPILNGSSGITAETFAVTAKNTAVIDGTRITAYEGSRKVIGAYISASDQLTFDETGFASIGQPVSSTVPGQYAVLALEYGRPKVSEGTEEQNFADAYQGVPGASTLLYQNGSNYVLDLDYQVEQIQTLFLPNGKSFNAKQGFSKSTAVAEHEVITGEINPLVNEFRAGRHTPETPYDDTDYLDYQLYAPKNPENAPLVVWLHGWGEGRNGGGIQNQNLLRANKEGTAWVIPESQAVRKAYILLPQSPNYGWYVDSPANDFRGYNNAVTHVKAVIDQAVQDNQGKIDPNRIYIAGDSMGGYGVWTMLAVYPGFFAAAIAAPGMFNRPDAPQADSNRPPILTADQINSVKTTPIWTLNTGDDFAQTEDNYTVIKNAGGNIRWTHYTDASERHADTWNIAHWVWVPALENRPATDDQYIKEVYPADTPGQHILDWLFAQHK